MSLVLEIQTLAQGHSVLYVEDNEPLRLNATKLLLKFFSDVRSAKDGEEALELFAKREADIVITDIKMPHLDGLGLIREIKKHSPKTKTIIMSAFDEKSMLLEAIESGVFAYLKKPVNITELTATLQRALQEIKRAEQNELFLSHLHTIFNYQSSMVAMVEKGRVVMANENFLRYFGLKKMQELALDLRALTDHFLAHDGFLYSYANIDAADILHANAKRLFHVKMRDSEQKIHHFILKYNTIESKKGFGILSFDDVTELNLLGLFDAKRSEVQTKEEQSRATFKLLEALERNAAEVEVHNFYKGLSITNKGIISSMSDGVLEIKTSFLQLKSIQFESKTIVVSEMLPAQLECGDIKKIGFERQVAAFGELRFVESSAVNRKTIRVSVEGNQSVSLFLNEKKFHADILIEDISLDGVRLSMNALPAGLQKDDLVRLDLVLELDKRPLIINTQVKVYTKSEHRHSFSVVFLFEDIKKSELVKYITKRQMAIIREFKGLQNG